MSINTTQAAETLQYLEANPELLEFLKEWDEHYRQRVTQISIFNYKKTSQWTLEQKSHFIKVFYHCRGHFHELLWFMASYAPDKAAKDIIIANIVDEIGENGFSHEKLFGMTAQAVGVDITKEYINHNTYLPFAKAFNQGHLQWLNDHNWDGKMSAFAALERLDNVDYVKGKELAESLGLKGKELTFFNVHIHVDHFGDVLKGSLIDIWNRDPSVVKEAFYFIAEHQIKMWNDLSNEVFNYSRKSVNRVEAIT